jgi:hypothetical protein
MYVSIEATYIIARTVKMMQSETYFQKVSTVLTMQQTVLYVTETSQEKYA